MSIEEANGDFVLICDICGHDSDEYYDYWDDAREAGKQLGWIQKYEGGGWIDICPECQG